MEKKSIIRLTVYSLTIGVPLLALLNCHKGWDGGTMLMRHCLIDLPIFRNFAQHCWEFLFISSFLLGIPVLLYLGAVVLVVEVPLYIISKVANRAKAHQIATGTPTVLPPRKQKKKSSKKRK